MSTPQELDAKMVSIDLDNIESFEEVFNLFYNNFIILLQNILENGCIESGYQHDSSIFNTEEIRISNVDEICTASRNLIRNEYYTRWPDKGKVAYLTTAFTTFLANQKLYKTFITDYVDQQDVISDLSQSDKFGNFRRLILRIEQFIIAILNRSQLNRIEEDLQTNCASLVSAATKEVESTKTFYQNVSQNNEFTQENLENLESKISRALKALQNSAKASNILARITPVQTNIDQSKFTFKGPGNMVTQISNLSLEIQVLATNIESHTWEDQKVDFKQDQGYIDSMDSLKLGNNLKFKINTQIPTLKFLQVKPTEAGNQNIASPRPLSPIDPIPIYDGGDDKTETESDDTLSGGDDPRPKPKIKLEKKARGAKYEMAIKNLTKSMIRVQSALNSEDDLKKTKAQNLLSELKNATEMARNVLYKTSGDKDTGRKLEQTIDSALEMMDNLTEILDSIHSQDQLRASLPKGSFPVWNGDAEGYLNFKKTILPHLESLTTEPLKLSTLKNQMTGHICEKIKRKLYNITTLDKFIEELDKRYGDLEKILPDKLKEMNKLKPNPRSKLQELTNVTALLSYVRVCESFDGLSNINLLWVTQYAFYLTESNACKLLATKGKPDKVIPLLEQISEEDESYNDIQPKTYNRDGYSPDWKNNGLRAKNYNGLECFICQGEHKFTYCPLLDSRKTMEEREKAILDRGLCLRCLYKWHPDHTCKNEERRFNCPMHQRNYNICKCGKNSDQLSEGKIESD